MMASIKIDVNWELFESHWALPQKIQPKGLRTWNSRGMKESTWKFQGLIKKEMEFPGVFKKNSCRFSMGLGFHPWNFQGVVHTISQNFQEWKLVFYGIFMGKGERSFVILLSIFLPYVSLVFLLNISSSVPAKLL